jgi:hypothetical protein
MSDQMNFSLQLHIPNKPQYSNTHQFATVEEVAVKINNNLYLKINNKELADDISENTTENPNYAYWCNEISGAYAKVSILKKESKTTVNKVAKSPNIFTKAINSIANEFFDEINSPGAIY